MAEYPNEIILIDDLDLDFFLPDNYLFLFDFKNTLLNSKEVEWSKLVLKAKYFYLHTDDNIEIPYGSRLEFFLMFNYNRVGSTKLIADLCYANIFGENLLIKLKSSFNEPFILQFIDKGKVLIYKLSVNEKTKQRTSFFI